MAPQDTFFDDEDDTCPLCIEEFDLSDRNFRPCPCGYQICQFCFNNLKNNLNGLCPACRRPYDDKDVKWKVVTREEEAEFRANIQKNQKKRATEQRQKEAQKREAEKENRKNLQGVRVVQKNLVYVTGLTPTVREDELLKTLRKPEFFGQYGNIQKISISNRKSSDGQQQSLGIYVTFEKKEDAAKCIAAVHGSHNGDRILKAQLGTTKYCSAWLRHEQCGNRQCMFLHELGDEEDSYSRQDLSSLNSVHTQRPLVNAASTRSVPRSQAPSVPPPATSQPMVRSSSKDDSEAGDGPALPATANWARTTQQRSRRGSHATSGAASSPAISMSLPATVESVAEPINASAAQEPSPSSTRKSGKQRAATPSQTSPAADKPDSGLDSEVGDFGFFFRQLASIPRRVFEPLPDRDDMPPLFDINGGWRKRAMRDEDENRDVAEPDHVDNLTQSDGELESGSLALGGEPEDRDQATSSLGYGQRRTAPIQRVTSAELFAPSLAGFGQASSAVGSIGNRTMTPQQQQQLYSRPPGSFTDQMPPGISPQQTSQPSSLFQGQGHSRQHSRFNFANEPSSSSVSVKSAADPRYMAQQSSMMPSGYRQPGGQLFPTSVSGPPPGLKSTGTPPVGAGMFGQGHGFGASNFGGAAKANPNDLLQSLIRGNVGNQAHDGKLDLADPSILQARMHHQQQGSSMGAGQGLFSGQTQDDDLIPLDEASSAVDALVSDSDPPPLQNFIRPNGVVPTYLPPGLGLDHAHPPASLIERAQSSLSQDRPNSRASMGRTTPALPQPATPLAPKISTKPTPAATRAKDEFTVGDNNAKKSIKELANTSGLAQDIAAQSSRAGAKLLQEEDFPSLDSAVKTATPSKTAATPSLKPAQTTKTPSGKKAAGDAPTHKAGENKLRKSDKRPVPGILDIAAATNPAPHHTTGTKTEAHDNTSAHSSGKIASTLATPTATTASVSSPLTKAGPRTIRLVQTPKTETPTANIAPAAVASIRSAAANSAHRPMTPGSEIISDTASIVSASISASRSSSPPPSKIGSLPARTTTKSQQRKQRKEASKEAAAQVAEAKAFEPEVEIAPIVGRKKKQKKEKKPTASRASSRPATPGISETHEDKAGSSKDSIKQPADASTGADSKSLPAATDAAKSKEQKGKSAPGSPKSPVAVDTSIKLNESTKTTVLTPDYVNRTPETTQEQPVEQDLGEIPQLRDVYRALKEKGALPEIEKIGFFQPPSHRFDTHLDANTAEHVSLPPTLKSIVTKEDEEKLSAFQPVRKVVNDHSVLLTPNGDCLLNLTPEEADRFLELQDRLRADSVRPTAFSAPRYAPASGFSLVKNRAVPNGTPSFFPLGPNNYPTDPVGKMHREEAISCINQHVLPSLHLGSYKAMGASSNFTKNVNLQQLAPWIYPPTDGGDDQRKLYSGRSSDEYSTSSGGNSTDAVYGGYDQAENGPSPAIGSTPLMSVEDAETVWAQAKKQHEVLDKKFRQLQARNRRLIEMH